MRAMLVFALAILVARDVRVFETWGAAHDPKTAAPKEFLEQLTKDSKRLADETRAQFKRTK